MTLSTTASVVRHLAAEEQTVFPYGFRLDEISHLQVFVDDALQASGYGVSGIGSDSGGNVTFAAAPRSGGTVEKTVTLRRQVPLTQTTDLPTQGAIDTAAIEAELDRLVMRAQQLDEVDRRSFKVPVESTVSGLELTPRGGSLLGWNGAATALVNYTAAAIAAGVVPTAFMEVLLADATADEARSTLGALARGGGSLSGDFVPDADLTRSIGSTDKRLANFFAGICRLDADGIKFNGDTAGANALNDYEEGTWTPGLSSGFSSFNPTTAGGDYTKIGNLVVCQVALACSDYTVGEDNAQSLTGLPFTVSAPNGQPASSLMLQQVTPTSTAIQYMAWPQNDSTVAALYTTTRGGAFEPLTASDWSGTIKIYGTLTYRAAA